MSRDRYERRHRRTHRYPAAVAMMAAADYSRVPPLAEALDLVRPEGLLERYPKAPPVLVIRLKVAAAKTKDRKHKRLPE